MSENNQTPDTPNAADDELKQVKLSIAEALKYENMLPNQAWRIEVSLTKSIMHLIHSARQTEREAIRALFDMSEFDIGGTMLDPHMMSRSKEYVAESRQYNSDHAWAAMCAQAKIDAYIKDQLNQSKEADI
jgi:hypothetical protein